MILTPKQSSTFLPSTPRDQWSVLTSHEIPLLGIERDVIPQEVASFMRASSDYDKYEKPALHLQINWVDGDVVDRDKSVSAVEVLIIESNNHPL